MVDQLPSKSEAGVKGGMIWSLPGVLNTMYQPKRILKGHSEACNEMLSSCFEETENGPHVSGRYC